jgi:hypothetical protein
MECMPDRISDYNHSRYPGPVRSAIIPPSRVPYPPTHRFFFIHITYGKPVDSWPAPVPKTASRTFLQNDGGRLSTGAVSGVIGPDGGTNPRCIVSMGIFIGQVLFCKPLRIDSLAPPYRPQPT